MACGARPEGGANRWSEGGGEDYLGDKDGEAPRRVGWRGEPRWRWAQRVCGSTALYFVEKIKTSGSARNQVVGGFPIYPSISNNFTWKRNLPLVIPSELRISYFAALINGHVCGFL